MKKQTGLTKNIKQVISIRKSTHKHLKGIKKEYDTYEDLINILIDHWDKTQKLTHYSTVPKKNHTRPVKEWTIHTINLHKNTKTRLDNLGKKNDTYDNLITRLLNHWDKTQKK